MFKTDRDTKAGQVSGGNANTMTIGLVTDNVHDGGDYRVKVKFPTLPASQGSGQQEESFWCRIGTFGAGAGGQGAFFLPEVDDEVMVAFVNGDFNQGVVMGALWSGKDKPSFSNNSASSQTGRYNGDHPDFRGQADPKKNDIRAFSSRKGHELIFNDNASNPRLTIQSSTKHRIVLNDAGNEATKIEIYDGKEENYILIDTKNKKITIESKTGDILIKAKEKVRIEAKVIETDSSQNTKSHAGTNYAIKADSNFEAKAGGTMTLQSSGTNTIKGSTVNIN
ncbi:MAG TPA: phage baseplate assembly protein V [Pseudomonadota bacterium]|jgi:uncharacterized protein involved in type VI secretion and phage assembly|nr:phage baseplate assembly protein V [Pseudomonadota bacterium]